MANKYHIQTTNNKRHIKELISYCLEEDLSFSVANRYSRHRDTIVYDFHVDCSEGEYKACSSYNLDLDLDEM